MSAVQDDSSWVHYCPVCGPCLALDLNDESFMVIHLPIPHPEHAEAYAEQ